MSVTTTLEPDPFDSASLEALCKQHHGEITRAEQLLGSGPR
jgi:hypothetical protein